MWFSSFVTVSADDGISTFPYLHTLFHTVLNNEKQCEDEESGLNRHPGDKLFLH